MYSRLSNLHEGSSDRRLVTQIPVAVCCGDVRSKSQAGAASYRNYFISELLDTGATLYRSYFIPELKHPAAGRSPGQSIETVGLDQIACEG